MSETAQALGRGGLLAAGRVGKGGQEWLQETQAEQRDEQQLLPDGHGHGDDNGNRQGENKEIRADVEADERPGEGDGVAFSVQGRLPELPDRDAARELDAEAHNVIDDGQHQDGPGEPPGVVVGQDAQVEHQDRDLGAGQAEHVEDLHRVGYLEEGAVGYLRGMMERGQPG